MVMSIVAERSHRACIRVVIMWIDHVYIAELVFWEEETRTKVLGGWLGGAHVSVCEFACM